MVLIVAFARFIQLLLSRVPRIPSLSSSPVPSLYSHLSVHHVCHVCVVQADEAYHIGPSPAAQSYLRADAILKIAQESGAEAIHPGYGFLSENESFSREVAARGMAFVGPPPKAIHDMGSKAASKVGVAMLHGDVRLQLK